ncbi:response regulator transcription factor [Chrysiogenes arsenatis]|uniref:response regulator transcription factor n=1 Tax=Chrysiogenes arsenatis TaxID=309797 RepID=UPI00041B545C|nr:response regulator transcription factor [Chrysiogenes arsenatis]
MIRILIVDDHAVIRSGLAMLLSAQSDMEIIAEASNAAETRAILKHSRPDIILLDVNLPDQNGLELAEDILRQYGLLKILFLTMHDEPEYVGRALQIGASGYILKSAADTELIDAVRAVYSGEFALQKGLRENIARRTARKLRTSDSVPPVASLTKRELEVLRLVALGYTQQEIAEELGVSSKTVETHKSNIMEKLNTKKRSTLVKYALAHGIIQAT